MFTTDKHPSYQLPDEDKVTQVMVYTGTYLFWGEVTTKSAIRVSTWLRTNAAPDSLALRDGMVIIPGMPGSLKPVNFRQIHLHISEVEAFHIVPPDSDPPDYDPKETNRRMLPMTALVGNGFRMDGCLRVASGVDLAKYLEIAREVFTPLYNVTVSHPALAHFDMPTVPYILVRQQEAVFTSG